MKRIVSLIASAVLLLTLCVSCAPKDTAAETSAQEDTGVSKIAILLPGYITDKSWNQGAYEGLKELELQGYEIAYTEDVQAADMESTFRTYCEDGYDFVIGHGVQYGDACVRVAQDYPDVYFFITGNPPEGGDLPQNIAFYDYKEFEGAYVSGYLAALMSESNIIGYIGGGDNTTQCSDKNAFVQGAKAAKADIEVKTVITGTFNDSGTGKETALAMIEQGVDVILQTCDETGLGAFEACNEKGVYCIGYTSDQASLVDDGLCLTSLLVSIPKMITSQIDLIEAGTFGGLENPGLKEGVIALAPYSDKVPADIQTQVDAVKQSLMDGTLTLTADYSK
ncbi:MAG: BMP family protein [Oscillospiraceae bacterium]|nr:BMP family protein [Oscillospiraceae bacterium]